MKSKIMIAGTVGVLVSLNALASSPVWILDCSGRVETTHGVNYRQEKAIITIDFDQNRKEVEYWADFFAPFPPDYTAQHRGSSFAIRGTEFKRTVPDNSGELIISYARPNDTDGDHGELALSPVSRDYETQKPTGILQVRDTWTYWTNECDNGNCSGWYSTAESYECSVR